MQQFGEVQQSVARSQAWMSILGVTTPSFTFLSIGDWGLAEGSRRVAPLMASWQPDFVLALGDNFYGKGAVTFYTQWKTVTSNWKEEAGAGTKVAMSMPTMR